jgi:nitric oxide reductase NorD protein
LTRDTPKKRSHKSFRVVTGLQSVDPIAAQPVTSGGTEQLRRLEMLGSALAGRAIAVEDAGSGEPAWTDGQTVYVDADASARERLSALAVQSSLIAAGSLGSKMSTKLVRRPTLTPRYLAIEGVRALQANSALLPPALSSLQAEHDPRNTSPEDSYEIARTKELIAEPPPQFGVIYPRKLLDKARGSQRTTEANEHIPRKQQNKTLEELDQNPDEGADFEDPFTSPVGGSRPMGKLFAKLTTPRPETKRNGTAWLGLRHTSNPRGSAQRQRRLQPSHGRQL